MAQVGSKLLKIHEVGFTVLTHSHQFFIWCCLVLAGGFNDFMQFDPTSLIWTDLAGQYKGIGPTARWSFGLTCANSKLYLYGGYSSSGGLNTLDFCDGMYRQCWHDSFRSHGRLLGIRHRRNEMDNSHVQRSIRECCEIQSWPDRHREHSQSIRWSRCKWLVLLLSLTWPSLSNSEDWKLIPCGGQLNSLTTSSNTISQQRRGWTHLGKFTARRLCLDGDSVLHLSGLSCLWWKESEIMVRSPSHHALLILWHLIPLRVVSVGLWQCLLH